MVQLRQHSKEGEHDEEKKQSEGDFSEINKLVVPHKKGKKIVRMVAIKKLEIEKNRGKRECF